MPHLTDFSIIDKSKYYFDEEAANSAVSYIENNIKHVSGEKAGQPFILEDWQKEQIVRPIFGWKIKATGFRKYKRAYIEIPKKTARLFYVLPSLQSSWTLNQRQGLKYILLLVVAIKRSCHSMQRKLSLKIQHG